MAGTGNEPGRTGRKAAAAEAAAAEAAAAEAAAAAAAAGATPPAAGAGTAPGAAGDPAKDAAIAAAAQMSRGEPENAARAASAAAGSTLDAPGVGNGPAGRAGMLEADRQDVPLRPSVIDAFAARIAGTDQMRVEGPAGTAPGIFDTLGSHGPRLSEADLGDARDQRRSRLAADLRRQAVTAAKLAVTMPDNEDALDDYFEAGFDFVVMSRQDGRRRAGVQHPAVPTLRRSQDFSEHELLAIRRDPMLAVQRLR